MKNAIPLLGFFLIAISLTSCKTQEEKKAEQVTNNYVHFVDSISHESNTNILANWASINTSFENKTAEINTEIDNLEDNHDFDAKIDSAIAKYEVLKKTVLLLKENK